MIDGQTNDSDFIGRCPTNVERPINCYFLVKKIFIFSKEVEIKRENSSSMEKDKF